MLKGSSERERLLTHSPLETCSQQGAKEKKKKEINAHFLFETGQMNQIILLCLFCVRCIWIPSCVWLLCFVFSFRNHPDRDQRHICTFDDTSRKLPGETLHVRLPQLSSKHWTSRFLPQSMFCPSCWNILWNSPGKKLFVCDWLSGQKHVSGFKALKESVSGWQWAEHKLLCVTVRWMTTQCKCCC